jgi:hypothetical protein
MVSLTTLCRMATSGLSQSPRGLSVSDVARQAGIPRDALFERASTRRPRLISSSTAGDENAQRPTPTREAGRASPPPPANLDARRLGAPDSDSPPASRGETSAAAASRRCPPSAVARAQKLAAPRLADRRSAQHDRQADVPTGGRASTSRSAGIAKAAGDAVDRKQADPAKRIVVFLALAT